MATTDGKKRSPRRKPHPGVAVDELIARLPELSAVQLVELRQAIATALKQDSISIDDVTTITADAG